MAGAAPAGAVLRAGARRNRRRNRLHGILMANALPPNRERPRSAVANDW